MGWFFKRSTKFGPLRLNFSKSGIGVSAGIRGARVSTGPKGTYINVGSKGFYYRQKFGKRHSATSGAGGMGTSINSIPYQGVSLPPNLRYPTFPKHGPPRIVVTLGLLSIPAVIMVWILALIGVATNSSGRSGLHDNSLSTTQKGADIPVQTNRERGFRAGFDYAVSTQSAKPRKKLDKRRLKQLATQMTAKEQEDLDWQQGWIEGYSRGSDKSISSNDSTIPPNRPVPRATATPTIQQFRTANNGYIRGPRGGCYYLSGSGRKVYVNRGLCN